MRLEDAMVRLRQTEVLHVADCEMEYPATDPALQRQRQPRIELALVGRLAEQKSRKDMRASPRAHEELLRYVTRAKLGGDVHCRIAHPDDENALAPEVDRGERIAIGMRMNLRAVEVPGIGGLWQAGIPVMTVADEQGVVGARLAVAQADLSMCLARRAWPR